MLSHRLARIHFINLHGKKIIKRRQKHCCLSLAESIEKGNFVHVYCVPETFLQASRLPARIFYHNIWHRKRELFVNFIYFSAKNADTWYTCFWCHYLICSKFLRNGAKISSSPFCRALMASSFDTKEPRLYRFPLNVILALYLPVFPS